MARGGVYKTEIEKARQALLAEGKRPSVDAVRVALGNTGSKTTIHRYLKELEAEEAANDHGASPISAVLTELVQRLSERLLGEADTKVAEAAARFDAQRKAQNDQMDQLRKEAAAASAQLQRTESTLYEERTQHDATRQALADATLLCRQLDERVAGLTLRVTEHEAHARSLEEKHAHARDALDHYRAAVKEQRDQEQRRHAHQVQGLQVDARHAQEALTAKTHEVLTLNRDNARLVEQLQHRDTVLTELRRELRAAHHRQTTETPLANEHPHLLKRLAEAQHAQSLLQERCEAVTHDLVSEQQTHATLRLQYAALSARLDTMEAMLPAHLLGQAVGEKNH